MNFRRRHERPTPREQEVLDVIDALAAKFGRQTITMIGGHADVDHRAVQVYLCRRALSWGLCRISRRIGIHEEHAIRLYDRGRGLVAEAVREEKITPRMVKRLMPPKVFM
jgi:hypothetical protein